MSNRNSAAAVLLGVGTLALIGTAAAAGTVAAGKPLPSWVPVQLVPTFAAVGIAVPGSPAAPASPTSPTVPALPVTGGGRLIVIDPGHGNPDPGAPGAITEAAANLALSLTLAAQLQAVGFRTVLTRTGAARPPGNDEQSYGFRTNYRAGQLCLISVHHNSAAAPGNLSGALVFRQQHRADSAALAAAISRSCGIRVLDTWESRFDRLYIDNARAPAVLWEATAINNYQSSATWRAAMCAPVVRAVLTWAATLKA